MKVDSEWIKSAIFIPKKERELLVAILNHKKSVKVKQFRYTQKELRYEVVETNNTLSVKVGEILNNSHVQSLIDNNIQVKVIG